MPSYLLLLHQITDRPRPGSPDEIMAAIERCREAFGGFEHASLQVNFNMMPLGEAQASMRLFAEKVMPRFTAGS